MRPVWKTCAPHDLAFEQAHDVEAEEDQRGQCRVEERDAGAQQPAARRQLREQQDRQRAPGRAAGDHDHGHEDHVAGEQHRDQDRQRQQQALALDPPERDEAEGKVEHRRGDEGLRCRNLQRAQVEQQRRAEEDRAADGTVEADDPENAPFQSLPTIRGRRRRQRRAKRGGR
ncbi:MAG: hypothetical protein IPQ15_14330 [Betaproteobacteria bacterium]|nr:hypothetical protein [Betaproteobacteria bacterium]